MATTDLIGAQTRTDRPTPSAPLPSAALAAMRSLELRLTFPAAVVEAVTRYETAAVHARDLAAVAASGGMSDLDADSLAAAEDLMAGAQAVLADAGRLDLIEAGSYVRVTPEVQRAVARYRICRDTLAEMETKSIDTAPLFNKLKNAQDGLAEARAILVAAGQLHLIEVAS